MSFSDSIESGCDTIPQCHALHLNDVYDKLNESHLARPALAGKKWSQAYLSLAVTVALSPVSHGLSMFKLSGCTTLQSVHVPDEPRPEMNGSHRAGHVYLCSVQTAIPDQTVWLI